MHRLDLAAPVSLRSRGNGPFTLEKILRMTGSGIACLAFDPGLVNKLDCTDSNNCYPICTAALGV